MSRIFIVDWRKMGILYCILCQYISPIIRIVNFLSESAWQCHPNKQGLRNFDKILTDIEIRYRRDCAADLNELPPLILEQN